MGLARSLGWLGAHAAIATASSSFRFGAPFPGVVFFFVVEGCGVASGGGSDCFLVVGFGCVPLCLALGSF